MPNTRNIRYNTDFKYIMLHYSEHYVPVPGRDINSTCVQNGFFGIPYDIIINANGKIDVSPRWIRAANPNQYTENVPVYKLFKWTVHDIADVCPQKNMNYEAVHIVVVGNFDVNFPTLSQVNSLRKVISQASIDLPLLRDVIYHSDIVNTSCPGINFVLKSELKKILIPPILQVGGDNIQPTIANIPFFRITNDTSTTVSMEWGNIENLSQISHFNIYHSGYRATASAANDYTIIATLSPSSTSFVDTILLPGYLQAYRLTATYITGEESGIIGSDSTYTDPQGAWDVGLSSGAGILMTYGPYTTGLGDNPNPSFFGNHIDHSQVTVEFLYKPGTTFGGTVWRRSNVERFSVGATVIGLSLVLSTSGEWIVNAAKLLAAESPFVSTNTGVFVDNDNSWHHWAFVFLLNQASGYVHRVYIYKDSVLQDPLNVGCTIFSNLPVYSSTASWDPFITSSIFAHDSYFYLMRGVNGQIDEFRYWRTALVQSQITATYDKIVREHPDLIIRYGFDNFSLQSPAYDIEFADFGVRALSPAIDDIGNDIDIHRRISEPHVLSELEPLDTPILLLPLNESIDVELNPEFFWNAVFTATSYTLEISTDPAFSTILYTITGITATTYTMVSTLDISTTYYWRIKAYDSFGASSEYSETFTFNTGVDILVYLRPTQPSQLLVLTPYDVEVYLNPTQPTETIVATPYDVEVYLNPTLPTEIIS